MIGNAPHSIITGCPGWETEEEQFYLLELAKQVPENGQITEIGGEYSMSSSIFCRGAKPDVTITTIDLFPDRPEGNLLTIHLANLTEAGYGGRTTPIQANSNEYEWTGGPLDLLFIDGAHEYEAAKADIRQFVKFVKVGGVVAFHDCACATNPLPHVLHFEVTRAVSEWFWATKGKWKALEPVRTILGFERIK